MLGMKRHVTGETRMNRNTRSWHVPLLVSSLILAAMLFITYAIPATAGVWHVLDVGMAHMLNSLISDNHAIQLFWAYANMRVFDLVMGLLMTGLLAHYVARGSRNGPAMRGAQAVVLVMTLLFVLEVVRDMFFPDIRNPSPSMVLDSLTRLSDLTHLDFKEASSTSFPSDHATVAATFTLMLWAIAGWRYGLAATVLAVIACLPRLVVGAHWLTDDVVGGIGAALTTVPWVIFTPFGAWLASKMAPVFARVGFALSATFKRGI